MGTEITLSIDGVDLSYSKNSMGMDHGALFQESDRKRMKSEQNDSNDLDTSDDPDFNQGEMVFSKPMYDVIPRIELLGFTLDSIRSEYELCAIEHEEQRSDLEEAGIENLLPAMSFDNFLNIISSFEIAALDSKFYDDLNNDSLATNASKFMDVLDVHSIPFSDNIDICVYSEQSFLAGILHFLHPYSALRLLGENKENLNQDVIWHYGPLVDSGWAKEDDFQPGARREQNFLVVTEGHSDVKILDLAIKTIRPEIHDFFCFIDMTEGHPFGGTGPLQKFAKGLAKMDVHNQTLFLYDNDTEGLSACQNTKTLNLPPNMKVAMLPDHISFESFQTVGPNGNSLMNINGKAVAIECYLDLNRTGLPPEPFIRWSGYKADVRQYQGALNKKNKYADEFLKYSPEELTSCGYDLSKLKVVVNTVFAECVTIATDIRKIKAKLWRIY